MTIHFTNQNELTTYLGFRVCLCVAFRVWKSVA